MMIMLHDLSNDDLVRMRTSDGRDSTTMAMATTERRETYSDNEFEW